MTQVQIQAVTLDGGRELLADCVLCCIVLYSVILWCAVFECVVCVCMFEGVWHIWYTEMNVT